MGRHEQETPKKRPHPAAYGLACVVLGGAVTLGFAALGATGGNDGANQNCTFAVVNGNADGQVLHCTTPTTPPPTSGAPTTTPPTTTPPPTTPPPTKTSSPPPTTGWPNATNTGVPAGTKLAASGSLTVKSPGTVLNGLDITGNVVIRASNVVIENSKIEAGTQGWGVEIDSGSVTIQDSELTGSAYGLVEGDNYTLLRDNLHAFHGDGMKLGNNVTVQDSWIHDAATQGGQHCDGMQAQNGLSNVVVKHNAIDPDENGSNSAVFIKNDLGPNNTVGPVLIDDNLLGGGGYTLYVYKGSSGLVQGGVTVENNRFLNDEKYGPVAVNIPVATWTGNVYDASGNTISK